ncbi:ATP-binding protein [Cytobacillus horneckiae]|uniref:ATP-binding protein n=1 Tax=Cytobacillus horneckiae TaxID=549687 RepID=UPI002DB8FCEF|nr:ATP-binding protein [Cytobacillus horneckiae]MEC1157814.1 ATP-binding protein [Cytobacillus horneckiae]MED2940708.1 ATP-binding protein [Cytobacillus horneckiae]
MKNNQFIHAFYHEQVIKEYEGNPLIEALPPILSKQEVVEKLCYYPHFDESERQLDSQYRFHIIQRLFSLFQVLPFHIDLESRLSRLLRQGYIGRNPFSPTYASSLIQGHENIQNQVDQGWFNHSIPRGLTIIGPSGTGKSTAIAKIFNQLPQIIKHSSYRGKDFLFTQLVFLRLECSHDASVKGLVNQFFITVDGLLGTNYFEKFGRSNKLSVNTLMPIMTQIINSVGAGILCIDEVQHLSIRGVGSKLMLNFFTTLNNMIGIPIVLIGTPSAMNVLQREFRQARRGSGQGDLVMDRMENNAYWRLFLESMWEYQWVRNPVELTDEMVEVLYQESQGIIDICLKLFSLSQIRAISSGSECLSVTLVRQVARDHLKLVQPMLTALKSGDLTKIAQYEDIYFPFQEAVERERIDLEKHDFIKVMKNKQKSIDDTKLREEALFRLNLLGLTKEKAKKAINEVCKATTFTDLRELVNSAYQFSLQIAVENEGNKETRAESDLRTIVKDGKEMGLSAYASLKDSGIIKQIKEVV